MDTIESLKATIDGLKDEIAAKDRRIGELRKDVELERKIVADLRELIEEYQEWIGRFEEGWEITRTNDGTLTSEGGWDAAREYVDKYNELVRRWNRYAATIQPVGRPIEASDAQEQEVVALRKKGVSLRGITKQTGLGLKTVRTIIAHAERNDTGTQRRAAALRIKIDRQPLIRLEARRKTRDMVRRQLGKLKKRAKELAKA
jgi:hypothetical protein